MADHRIQGAMERLPPQLTARPSRIGHQHRRIPRTSSTEAHGNRPPRHPLGGLDHLAYRIAVPGAQIEDPAASTIEQPLQCQQVGAAEISHMHVVADAVG